MFHRNRMPWFHHVSPNFGLQTGKYTAYQDGQSHSSTGWNHPLETDPCRKSIAPLSYPLRNWETKPPNVRFHVISHGFRVYIPRLNCPCLSWFGKLHNDEAPLKGFILVKIGNSIIQWPINGYFSVTKCVFVFSEAALILVMLLGETIGMSD